MNFATGTLVRARGREWVVLPESEPDFLVVRPLGGTTQETAGIHTALEEVKPASFEPPTVNDLGDFVSCRLLRDAARFGFRSSAGPFRSFGRLAFQPRPYQLVPLMMALKLDPVRLLIADDVGIGKTIEAGLIAREMLDRAEVTRICVLCPPHLAEQWQQELATKFNIFAELVLSSTARRLEKNLRGDQSIFDAYPFTIVSTEFIKSESRRYDFLRTCPDFVIVDEAHGCAASADGRGAAHQRYLLLKELAKKSTRHLVLVTATPHSGNEEDFRALLGLLKEEFLNLLTDLSGPEKEPLRRKVAAHLVQRRRENIRHYLHHDTPFPERKDKEDHYILSSDYRALFNKVLDYARETVRDGSGGVLRQRVRWWSALSLLRAMASSPAAAATLRERSRVLEAETEVSADQIGRQAVLDGFEDGDDGGNDVNPGADPEPPDGDTSVRGRLLSFAREAEKLRGDSDNKLVKLAALVSDLLREGFKPIVFCRFIETADYVAGELRSRLNKDVEVTSITSQLPPDDRSARIAAMTDAVASKRVLVCTDCLSEGINLQEKFDAVIHYDLSWNPTRHEQREGRVDRYGQKNAKNEVRVLTYYGTDNQIDGIVLDVLLRKHVKIRKDTGVSVPIPVDSEQVVNAVFEGLLLRSNVGVGTPAEQMTMFEEFFRPQKQRLHEEWEAVADREKRSRHMFAQESIKFQEVAQELEATERAIGSPQELAEFMRASLLASGAVVNSSIPLEADLAGTPKALREAAGGIEKIRTTFEPTEAKGVLYLYRTHPIVEGLASFMFNSALDPAIGGVARRAGVARTKAVTTATTLLLLRLRFHIVNKVGDEERNLLAEDSMLVAFTGDSSNPEWFAESDAEKLLSIKPDANVPPDLAANAFSQIRDGVQNLRSTLGQFAEERGAALLEAHRRVRTAAGGKGSYRIESNPPDVLGVYVFLPIPKL